MASSTGKKLKKIEQFKSVTPDILDKLAVRNLSVADIATASVEYLTQLLQEPEKKVQKLIAEARKNVAFNFETMESLKIKRAAMRVLDTGCPTLNKVLGGGIETQAILEVYGESTAGKSHLMHQLAASALRPQDEGGLDGAVLFIDTEGTFRYEKMVAIAQRLGITESLLRNLVYIRVGTSTEQRLVLEEALEDTTALNKYLPYKLDRPLKVIIIDSMISHFRAQYSGRGMLAERQQILNGLLSKCLHFVHANNALVLITNQIVNIPDAPMFAATVKAAGGAIISHATTFRLYLRKGRGNTRIIKIIDAPNLGQDQVVVALTGAGIEDAE